MAVKARITAIKSRAARDSIVERISSERVHVEASTGDLHAEVILRKDGRMSIEVKRGRRLLVDIQTQDGEVIDGWGGAFVVNGRLTRAEAVADPA